LDGFSAHDYGSRNVRMYAISDVDKDGQDDLIIPTLSKKKIAILSMFENNDDTIYVNDSLDLSDKLTSKIFTLDINYDGYVDIIAGDRSGNLYIFTSQVKYKN
jgi:Tfp pilus tip-associated adhesin PilY1